MVRQSGTVTTFDYTKFPFIVEVNQFYSFALLFLMRFPTPQAGMSTFVSRVGVQTACGTVE